MARAYRPQRGYKKGGNEAMRAHQGSMRGERLRENALAVRRVENELKAIRKMSPSNAREAMFAYLANEAIPYKARTAVAQMSVPEFIDYLAAGYEAERTRLRREQKSF